MNVRGVQGLLELMPAFNGRGNKSSSWAAFAVELRPDGRLVVAGSDTGQTAKKGPGKCTCVYNTCWRCSRQTAVAAGNCLSPSQDAEQAALKTLHGA